MKTFKHESAIARVSIVVIFLALIRTIIEPIIRHLSYDKTLLLLICALIISISCLVLTILSFFSKNKSIILISLLTIIILVIFKSVLMI